MAKDATEGIKIGDEVTNTKAPIHDKVGLKTLRRILNVME